MCQRIKAMNYSGNTNGIKPKNNNVYVVQNNYGADLSIFSDYKSINYGTYTVYYK